MLPQDMASVHRVFQISVHNMCLGDSVSILPVEGLGIDENLSYEDIPIEILDVQVKRLRKKEVATMKV